MLLCKTPSEGKDGKTYWRTVGRAFKNKAGGLNVLLDVIPLPVQSDYGPQIQFSIFEQEERQEQAPAPAIASAQGDAGRVPLDDEIPFEPETRG